MMQRQRRLRWVLVELKIIHWPMYCHPIHHAISCELKMENQKVLHSVSGYQYSTIASIAIKHSINAKTQTESQN